MAAERLVAEYTGSTSALIGELIRTWWHVGGNSRMACMGKLITGEAKEVNKRANRLRAHLIPQAPEDWAAEPPGMTPLGHP